MTAKSPSRMEMERALFEAYCLKRHKATVRHTVTGEYLFRFVERDWQTWLAARERPDEVVVMTGIYTAKGGGLLHRPEHHDHAVSFRGDSRLDQFDGQHVAVVVRKSEEKL